MLDDSDFQNLSKIVDLLKNCFFFKGRLGGFLLGELLVNWCGLGLEPKPSKVSGSTPLPWLFDSLVLVLLQEATTEPPIVKKEPTYEKWEKPWLYGPLYRGWCPTRSYPNDMGIYYHKPWNKDPYELMNQPSISMDLENWLVSTPSRKLTDTWIPKQESIGLFGKGDSK